MHNQNANHVKNGLCTSPQCASKALHASLLCEDAINANSGILSMNQICVGSSPNLNMGSLYEPADVQSSSTAYNANIRKSRTTALETVVLTALNKESSHLPIHLRQVACMLDTGAQRSVITKKCVLSMNFPIVGKERVALQGFNERSPRNLTYNVAQVQLGKTYNGAKPITIDALVVNDINKLQMVGAAAFAKKLAKKNYTLADHRFLNTKSDEISLDMLVGNEHRQKIISPKLPSIQLYGMFCPRTVYGGIVLSGTIPGPGSIS